MKLSLFTCTCIYLLKTWKMFFKTIMWGDLQDGRGVRHGDHLPPHKCIKNTSTCGTTPTEHLLNADRRPQTSQKSRKSPRTCIGKKKKQRQKNRDGTCTSGRELWRRKSFHTLGRPFTGVDRGWEGEKLHNHGGEHSNRGAEGKEERFLHRGSVPTSTHQSERLVCSPTGAGGGWELRLGLQRSDPRERTGLGCVNTAWRGLVHHNQQGGSLGKSLDLPKRQQTIDSGCARWGDSFPIFPQKVEHHLNELQR